MSDLELTVEGPGEAQTQIRSGHDEYSIRPGMFVLPDLSELSMHAGDKRKIIDLTTPSGSGDDPADRQGSQKLDIVEQFMLDAKVKTFNEMLIMIRDHLKAKTSTCSSVLILIWVDENVASFVSTGDLTDCTDGDIDGNKVNFKPLIENSYLLLKTASGCDLSVMGMSRSSKYIEISSTTAPSQYKKGYNSLMRAIAVFIAYKERLSIVSEVSNPVSAYALLTRYETVVEWKTRKNTTTYTYALSKEQARKIMKDVSRITIHPSDSNFERAARVIVQSDVLCANHKPR